MTTATSRVDAARLLPTASNDNGLDQYYTNAIVAAHCYATFRRLYPANDVMMVEPSAGTGSFFKLMPAGSLAYDLDPRCVGVERRDFLTVEIVSEKPVVMIGNPPFGKNASLAIRFFNHAAHMSQMVAFIVPRTFRKASVQNRLDRSFHVVHDEVLPQHAFIFEGERYDVRCAFQVWERRPTMRPLRLVETTHPEFAFTTPDRADFAIQRIGVNAGRVKLDLTVSPQSHYFVAGDVIDVMRKLDFDRVRHDTAGNPSIAKSEIVALYREQMAAVRIAA